MQGPRRAGKTASAQRFARSVVALDQPLERARVVADPRAYLDSLEPPVLIDEWQLEPAAWEGARRSVDADWTPGRFLITGSANPRDARVHTGAGRFLTLRMRPLSFAERAIETPTAVWPLSCNPALRATSRLWAAPAS